jgi:exodeoxyribonuclease VII large subunit
MGFDARVIQTVTEFYAEVDAVLKKAFPRNRAIWVRAEIQSINEARTGHCYVNLVDPTDSGTQKAVLNVNIWRNTWGPLKNSLAKEGITLAAGMVVVVRGQVNLYPARGTVSLNLMELDVAALLGRIAQERAALLEALSKEGLLERQRGLSLPLAPLRIGLVASPNTEGYNDFLGQLTNSGFSFAVTVSPAAVQGASAPSEVATAIASLSALGTTALDLICIVRGGGSKADLAGFDHELIARAIATCPLPIWTGIGHTGDESVADLVANRSLITPTECGRELALLVTNFYQDAVVAPARTVLRGATNRLETTQNALQRHGERIASLSNLHLANAISRVDTYRSGILTRANNVVVRSSQRLSGWVTRLGPAAVMALRREEERLAQRRRLIGAYDIERQLARGYSLTMNETGVVLRSTSQVKIGATILTKMADGTLRSVVTEATRSPEEA